jgi:membrane protein implicated in regulation of membrane protease activity
MIPLFIALQALDVITTLVGFRLGAGEASPFIRHLIGVSDPVTGLLLCKLIAFTVAGLALAIRRRDVLQACNVISAAVVVWNVVNICVLLSGGNITVAVFVAWVIGVNVLLFFWYRRARRKRQTELLQRRIEEAIGMPFDLHPRDVAQLREMVEEAHRSHHA